MSARGLAILALALSAPAAAQYSGRFGCTGDCSGHEAGYAWAADRGLAELSQCGGRSQSFIEGCQDYVLQVQEGRAASGAAPVATPPAPTRLAPVEELTEAIGRYSTSSYERRRALAVELVRRNSPAVFRCEYEDGTVTFTNEAKVNCIVVWVR